MRTQKTIVYTSQPYGVIATIPKGTKLVPASNLPPDHKYMKYWAQPWRGMTDQAKAWGRNYGFLIMSDDLI